MEILYAAHDLANELLGLTTVFGNVPVQKATPNAQRLCELGGLDIPVAEGAAKRSVVAPLDPAAAARIHGGEGFGPVPPETPQRTPIEDDAADFMASMARRYPGEVTLCAIGPITNRASDEYIGIYEERGLPGCGLHDPAAVIACVAPDLFKFAEMPLSVILEGPEIGRTMPGAGPTTAVCEGVDAQQLKERFFSIFG